MDMKKFIITDFGAKSGEGTVNTAAVQKAVDECGKSGGGTVVIPSGVFYTGSIQLLSNVTLYLENGAVLKSTADKEDFGYIGFWHNEMKETTSLLWAREQENICICGDGIIDISADKTYEGETRMEYCTDKPELLDERRRSEGVLMKNEDRVNQPIFFESCRNIKITGIKIINSTCWTVTFSRSRDIKVSGIEVDNNLNIQNNDGIHLSSCKNAIISDCSFSCADDCIALTCITDRGGINENITICNCLMRSRSAAVRIGHSTRNVSISNLNVYETNRGICIFTGTKTHISDIAVSNVKIKTALLAGCWWGKAEPIIICSADENSSISDVSIRNMSGVCENGIIIYGKKHNIRNITLDNINIKVKETEYFNDFCDGLDMRPYAYVKDDGGPCLLYTYGIGKISLSNVNIDFVRI